jgi:hypothetical protein
MKYMINELIFWNKINNILYQIMNYGIKIFNKRKNT